MIDFSKIIVKLTKSVEFKLTDDISEEDLRIFIENFIPDAYTEEEISKFTDEDWIKALEDYVYSDQTDLEDVLDGSEIIESEYLDDTAEYIIRDEVSNPITIEVMDTHYNSLGSDLFSK